MRPDGSQPSLLTNDPVDAVAASPIGGMAAYITHAPAGGSFYTRPFGYLLKLITLSNDNTYPVASLDPPGISASSPSQVLDSAAQSLVALNHGALAWSPTGSTLAFTSSQGSAQGQPSSSDVYLYSPNNGQIRRVSQLNLPDGPAHAYALEWSPGGTLLFFAVAYSFGATPDKALTAGAWVAGLNGTLTQVAQANQSSGEVLDAWLPNSQILLHSNNPGCGESNLRTVSYQTGQATDLWPGCYSDMLYDKLRAEVLISVSQSAANPGSNNPQGLYRISLYQPQPSAISDMGFEKLFAGDYKASWYGYSPGEGLLATQRDGSTAPIFTGDSYDGSNGALLKPLMRLPDGVTWLWTGEGNRLFSAHPGQPPQVLFDLPVQNLNPSPTVPGLYFFFSPGDNGLRLYGVRARDWQPFLVDTRMQDPNGLAWAR